MNLTLLEVPHTLSSTPLARSRGKLIALSEALDNPKFTPERIQADFALYYAQVYKERIKEAINTQRIGKRFMSEVYKPLNPQYAKTKTPGRRRKFWIDTGFLLDHITMWKYRGNIRVGIKANVRYPDSGTKAALVILWLEKGTKTIPARPLFIDQARFMSRHIAKYYNHYVELRFPHVLK